jgi:hypothetical protein
MTREDLIKNFIKKEKLLEEQSIALDKQGALLATAWAAYFLQLDISGLEKEVKENTKRIRELEEITKTSLFYM